MRSHPPSTLPPPAALGGDVVALFPSVAAPAPCARPTRFILPRGGALSARREYDFADMVRLCRLHRYAQRTQIDHLRLLASQAGLPLPKNARIHAGQVQTGPARIGARSVWCALEVDAWLDDQRSPPPAGGGALDVPPLPLADRDDLRHRARMLAGGGR